MAFPPGLRIGRYEVVRKLGQGGFGIIYVGRDVELDREVALKILRPEHITRPDLIQRFLQEARSAAKVHHAGIVTVFECGQVVDTDTRADATVYIAMELLHGESLHVRLKREGRLAPDLAINITRQVCSALMAAHQAGIVHRDLKPDNLFLVPDSAVRGGVRVKILDFGVAKLADGQFESGVRTHSAMLLGTPMYMSPEQCKSSAKVDHRSDIYAVGCILFQLLCGRAPYEGDAGELIAHHQLSPIPTTRAYAPELPPPLEALVTQMLAKTPDERPSIDAVESALASLDATSVVAGKAPRAVTKAPPPTSVTTLFEGFGERTEMEAKNQRRNLALGAVGVIGFGILLGVIVTRGGKEEPREPREQPSPAPTRTPVPTVVATPDAAPVLEPPSREEPMTASEHELRCIRLRADRKWPDLVACGDELSSSDPVKGKEFHNMGIAENKAESIVRRMNDAIKRDNLVEVDKLRFTVPESSVYRREAEDLYERAVEAQAGKAVKNSPPPPKTRNETDLVNPDPFETCDADAPKKKGEDYLGNGMDTAALAQFEASLRCKYSADVLKKAFLVACRSKQEAKAKLYYAKLPPGSSGSYSAICIRYGITVP